MQAEAWVQNKKVQLSSCVRESRILSEYFISEWVSVLITFLIVREKGKEHLKIIISVTTNDYQLILGYVLHLLTRVC